MWCAAPLLTAERRRSRLYSCRSDPQRPLPPQRFDPQDKADRPRPQLRYDDIPAPQSGEDVAFNVMEEDFIGCPGDTPTTRALVMN